MTDPDLPTRTEGETLDLPERTGAFSNGQVLGERYQILELLGRGGMGEVWRALDLKLRVEVALKALRPEFFKSERRLEFLRQEVRAAREVISPNVCRIFDLIEVEGRELVSMEYVDGATLLGVLQERGPLELKEAQDIASQFLAGLEAIHKVGLIHRDIKPENIMLTRAGRVVVMDFGLARQEAEGGGSVSGTPAYMSPEQAAGQTLDARADVYAAGVVLAEMVSPVGIKSYESRQSLWEGVRSEPAKVSDSPWAAVIKKAVTKDREGRYHSAHTLTRALEDVTLRVEGAEDLHPYPGLASFTEEDAEYFFGREAEVERMWRRLDGPARLLSVVGPSGAGKSSFLNAGLIPSSGAEWGIVRCTPGSTPFVSLGQALAREMAGDAEAVRLLVRANEPEALIDVVSRWRQRCERALLIVDQFEELFTHSPPDEQARFADMVGHLVLDSDVFVLLSMRDDFLLRCRESEALAPVFTDLTALLPPTGGALRRAMVRPATKCGYRFEDEDLVDEMLAEVEGERGALPLLAFAMSQLWERRDRHNGLLTRQAYNDVDGVGGALAQHAEATIDRIGSPRIPIVRELFRNLVTAEGTRAVRDWDELLSIFSDSRSESQAEEVLHELVDARLLTSYEVQEGDETQTRRVEIIHESLLEKWPRLVGWQTQDADSARMRDELRQAARAWEEHERSQDRLWTGSAYREFSVWCERYPGGLTETEDAFASAMTSLATRQRRRRRAAVTAVFAALLVVLAIIGGFWRRSVSEARRAEAANLVSLGRLALEKHPSATIAYAIASLEQADNPEVRRLAVEALWIGPTELRLPAPSYFMYSLEFSADGRWLAAVEPGGSCTLWPSDGGPPTVLEGGELAGEVRISPRGDLLAATMSGRQEVGFWSFPEGRFLRSVAAGDRGEVYNFQFFPDGNSLMTITNIENEDRFELEFRSWPVAGGEPTLVARVEVPQETFMANVDLDPRCSRIAWADGRKARIARIESGTADLASATSVKHDRIITFVGFDIHGQRLATADQGGTIRIWSLQDDRPHLTCSPPGGWAGEAERLVFDTSGSLLAATGGQLWDLTAPPETELLQLRDPEWLIYGLAFHPNGKWHATSVGYEVSLWPLARRYPRVLRVEEGGVGKLAFTADGERLVSRTGDGSIRLWPLGNASGERSRVVNRIEGIDTGASRLEVAPSGSFVAVGNRAGHVGILSLDGGAIRELGSFERPITALAVGPRSRLVAAGSRRDQAFVRVWDLESGEARTLDPGEAGVIRKLEFTENGQLWIGADRTLQLWSLEGAEPHALKKTDLPIREVLPGADDLCDIDFESRLALLRGNNDDRLWTLGIDSRESRELSSHGVVQRAGFFAGREVVVSSDRTGEVRVGPVTGEEPHLLLGHEMEVNTLAVSPDGRWIATGGDDKTIRLWPMPDLSRPAFHTLPREELIARLKALTNLRVVQDEASPTGWKLTAGPFPGWETVPVW